jgi:hypothetical protein
MIYAIARLNILGMLSIQIEKTERHAAQAPALRERYHKSSITVYPGWESHGGEGIKPEF